MMKKIFTFCALLVMFVTVAQVTNEKEPRSWSMDLNLNIQAEIMPAIDIASLEQEDELVDEGIPTKPYRFGEKIDVELDLFNSGRWTELQNGDRMWHLNIVSQGAKTINLMMDRYDLPAGAELYIYNDEHTDRIGPYTNAENQEDGILGTWIVYGDNIWLEYYEPSNVRGLGRVSIDQVIHGYRGFGKDEDNFLKLNESGACNVDVMCNPNQGSTNGVDWTTIRNNYRHAVARIIINGAGLCTGTLVNNVREDGTPYFLTADHCLGNTNDGAGASFNGSGWSFGFDWFTTTPDCATFANTTGPLNPTRVISGAVLRANRRTSDVALFELNQTPPASWDLYYAGWNNSTTASTAQLSMHHPSGDIMKLARNDQTVTTINAQNTGIICWRIADWDYGVTEGGSSGSCLIDPNGRIVGQLLGGFAACNGTVDNGTEDWYGKMDLSWNAGFNAATRLRDWLDPDNTGVTVYDGDFFSTLSSNDAISNINISVYPNPVQESFKVEISEKASYAIYTISGQVLMSGTLDAGTNTINMNEAANGVYFIKVDTDSASESIKLIKE